MEKKQKYKAIPHEFTVFVEQNRLGDPKGSGYERRETLAKLTGMPVGLLRDYILQIERTGEARAAGLRISKLKVAMRICGLLPAPSGDTEQLEHAFGLGEADGTLLAEALGVSSENLVGRIIYGDWNLSKSRKVRLSRFLAGIAQAVAAAEKYWRDALVASGFAIVAKPLREPPQSNPPAPPAAETDAFAVSLTGSDVGPPNGALVEAAGALILGLLPILKAINRLGEPEDFKRLRKITATSHSSHGVFELKQLLGPMCSEKAKEISKK